MFKRLKNGKGSEAFYLIPNDVSYTIRLTSKEDSFQLNTYSFAGNDVSDESNCKDEKISTFDDFRLLIKKMEKEYAGLDSNFKQLPIWRFQKRV